MQENFGNATQNVVNFQKTFKPEETFKTTAQVSYTPLDAREEKFKISQTVLTKDEAALEEYRKTWSNGNHNFARSYIGAEPYKKCQQE